MAYWGCNVGIADHIEKELKNGKEFKHWLTKMPSKTPQILSNYQRHYTGNNINFNSINQEILNLGTILPHGQILFHGGHWQVFPTAMVTTRPFATSFCPQVAMREAEHRAKSYDAGYIDLIYIRLDTPKTKAFIFKHNGTTMGHEKEVLFSTGARINFQSRTFLGNHYSASKYNYPDKTISTFLVEVTLS